jgi:hypothetical protein
VAAVAPASRPFILPMGENRMPCLVGCLALFMPRVAIVLVVIFSDYLGQAYETVLWPLLGFFFMPMTTLAYAWGHNSNEGNIDGGYLVVLILAVLFDLGVIGAGSKQKHAMKD